MDDFRVVSPIRHEIPGVGVTKARRERDGWSVAIRRHKSEVDMGKGFVLMYEDVCKK